MHSPQAGLAHAVRIWCSAAICCLALAFCLIADARSQEAPPASDYQEWIGRFAREPLTSWAWHEPTGRGVREPTQLKLVVTTVQGDHRDRAGERIFPDEGGMNDTANDPGHDFTPVACFDGDSSVASSYGPREHILDAAAT